MIFSRSSLTGIAVLSLLAGCSKPADPPPAPPAAAASAAPLATSVAWLKAGTDAEVDAAFARAAAEGKPVFLYWGATWCPPCNQVKATIFPRADFVERSRGFVPVYVDGDLPGAQKLGERFKVRGYPTMVLFRPDGSELTRLPGEVDAAKYLQVLSLGLSEAQPVKAALVRALADPAGLKADDWRQLAFYSWDTDEQQLLAAGRKAATLQQLADAVPAAQAEVATRLRLQALVASAEPGAGKPADAAAARAQLLALLADAAASREQQDILANGGADLVAALSAAGSAPRTELQAALDAALVHLNADASLSQGDRMNALIARVDLARLGTDKKAALPAPLLEQLRSDVVRASREIGSDDERQSVIPSAAHALSQAGLLDESDALLEAELKRSHSPYYAMLQLASNAKQRGDSQAALGWYERAYNESKGPATRVQWGSGYVNALLELAPQDTARIERAATSVYGELRGQPDAFYARTARSIERMNGKLAAWAAARPSQPERKAGVQRLQANLDELCRALPEADAQRSTCTGLGRTLASVPKAGKPSA